MRTIPDAILKYLESLRDGKSSLSPHEEPYAQGLNDGAKILAEEILNYVKDEVPVGPTNE